MLSSVKRGNVQNIFVTLIIGAMIITGIGYWFSGLAEAYPATVNTSGKYSGVMGNATQIFGQTQGITDSAEDVGESPDTLIGMTGFGAVINSVLGLPGFIQSLLFAIMEMAGLGSIAWIIQYIMLLVLIIAAFAVLNWLRGGANRL